MLATVAVNVITCLVLLLALQHKLGRLPLPIWGRDSLLLTLAAVVAGVIAWAMAQWIQWPSDLLGLALQVALCGGVGLGSTDCWPAVLGFQKPANSAVSC